MLPEPGMSCSVCHLHLMLFYLEMCERNKWWWWCCTKTLTNFYTFTLLLLCIIRQFLFLFCYFVYRLRFVNPSIKSHLILIWFDRAACPVDPKRLVVPRWHATLLSTFRGQTQDYWHVVDRITAELMNTQVTSTYNKSLKNVSLTVLNEDNLLD